MAAGFHVDEEALSAGCTYVVSSPPPRQKSMKPCSPLVGRGEERRGEGGEERRGEERGGGRGRGKRGEEKGGEGGEEGGGGGGERKKELGEERRREGTEGGERKGEERGGEQSYSEVSRWSSIPRENISIAYFRIICYPIVCI